MFPGYADTGCTHIAFKDPYTLNIVNGPLEKRHGVIFDDVSVFIDQQHAQVMGIEMLFVLLIQPVNIFNHLYMFFLMFNELLISQTVHLGHGLMGYPHIPAPLPGFRHPRVHIGIQDPLIHKFIVISRKFFLVSFFTNHLACPSFPPN